MFKPKSQKVAPVAPTSTEGGGMAAPAAVGASHARNRSHSESRPDQAPLLGEAHAEALARTGQGHAATPLAAGEPARRGSAPARPAPKPIEGIDVDEHGNRLPPAQLVHGMRPGAVGVIPARRHVPTAERAARVTETINVPSEMVGQVPVVGRGDAVGRFDTSAVPGEGGGVAAADQEARAAADLTAETAPPARIAGTGEDLNAPLLGTAEASVPSAQTQAQAPGKWEQVKKGWNELSTAKKVGIGVGSSIGLGLFIFFMVFFLGRKKPVSDGIIIQNQRENTTIYDGEIAYPINATYLSGHDQTVSAVLLFAYASLQSLSSNFTLRFADRETLVNAQNFNGSFSVPFGSLAEANSAFNQTQAIGAGNQEAALDLSVYAVDAKNRTTETIKTHTHYIPGPPPVLPLIISGEQNASLAQGQSYRPFGQFAVQNLGDAEANSAHLGMQLISSGQSSCQLTVNGQTTLIAVNSSFPRSLSTINLKGAIDLTSTMQGLQTGCSGDNATIYTQVFDTAGTRNDSNVLTSAGSYRVPPSPGPSPTPSPTPTPVPQCDGVSVLAAKQVSTLSNKPFYPLTGVQFASTNSSKPIADVQGAWGYCYNVNPAYNFFVDRQCDQNFPENTVDSQYNRCCQTTQGLSYSTAEGLYAQAGFQLQSGVKMGQTRVINGTFQPDQPGCPTSNTGIMAKITPIYMLQAEAEAVDLEQDVRPA